MAMKLTGLHLLLTYKCSFECDHCFVWGSPWQEGTMTLGQIQEILRQGEELGTVEWVYFEGGEPFLYYAALVRAVQAAALHGFKIGIVTNAYWATSRDDALECLRPFAGLVHDLSISSDLYHGNERLTRQARAASSAAEALRMPTKILSIAEPEVGDAASPRGQLPAGESAVRFRGRAVEKLASRAAQRPWSEFTECPCEDFRDPGRVHLDPFGNVHVCQGITIGNVHQNSLKQIWEKYDPESHPVIGPLLRGGPVELVKTYDLPHADSYADACHFCYESRVTLRSRFPDILAPDQMYGVAED
jgi:MoaA/NifB/PqqE/SkfB family radical SAM enzyme